MGKKQKAWSSPYKTILWLSNVDHELFCDRQKRLWAYIAHKGRNGSEVWNYKLALKFGVTTRTIQRDLRNLKQHCMLTIRPGWALLANGKFVEQLRYRRITALPWSTRQQWMRESLKNNLKNLARPRVPIHSFKGDKIVVLQENTNKISIKGRKAGSLPAQPVQKKSTQGSALTTASPTGLTGDLRINKAGLNSNSKESDINLFKILTKELRQKGFSEKESIHIAYQKISDRKRKNQQSKNK